MSQSTDDLAGQVVLVTGGTGGIGKATATELAQLGATTLVVGRNKERGQAAVADIIGDAGHDDVAFLSADLSSLAEVRELATTIRRRYDRLDVLVNNAGAMSADRHETVDGLELTFAMNVVSPFVLTNELLPLLERSAPSRIVNVNTQSFDLPWPFADYAAPDLDDLQLESDYNGMRAYVRSKTANLLWTFELARRLDGTGISVFAVNPGGADTGMQQEAQRAAPLPMRLLEAVLRPVMNRVLNTSVEAAANSSVMAAADPDLAAQSGLYLDPDGEPDSTISITRDQEMAAELWDVVAALAEVDLSAESEQPAQGIVSA